MEPGQDAPDKVTSVEPEIEAGPGEEAKVGPARVRLRAKTPDESWTSAGEEEEEPGGATKVEAYGGGQELVGTSDEHSSPNS